MKASLKFREDQKPLFRAKVPLTILGLPFQSAIAAGDSKELTLSLSTLFDSGPSFTLAYRPNDSWNPFSLLLKTGAGPFASPISSSILITAQFNLIARGNPSFMLHFHPRLGDFSIKKSHSSIFLKSGAAVAPDDESPDVADIPADGAFAAARFPGFSKDSHAVSAVSGFLSGMEVAASTAVPVRSHAAVNFRWGLRVPAEAKDGVSFRKAPFLVLNKIGIEHVDRGDSKEVVDKSSGLGSSGEACFSVKRQFEVLEMENGLLKKAIDDLRKQMKSFSNSGELDRNGTKASAVGRRFKDKKTAEFGGFDGPAAEEAAGEELRKALSGA